MSYAEALTRLKILKSAGGAGAKSARSPPDKPFDTFGTSVPGPFAESAPPEAEVVAWLNRNPPPTQLDTWRCLFCGGPEANSRPLLAILAGDDGHRWLHDVCLEPYWRQRRAEAERALLAAIPGNERSAPP